MHVCRCMHMHMHIRAMRSKLQRCLPASAIAYTSFEVITRDNILDLKCKRGDDPSLKGLLHARRSNLGVVAKAHCSNVRAEAAEEVDADGNTRTEDEVGKCMETERLNFSTKEGDVNPQLDVPLSIAEFMLVENLHAGLRICPSEIRQLTTISFILHENGLSNNPHVVADCLWSFGKVELLSVVKNLRSSKNSNDIRPPGNMMGRMVDLAHFNHSTLFEAVKRHCGGVPGWELTVTALHVKSALHRNLLGPLRQDKEFEDEDVEKLLNWGLHAFNVHAAFFPCTPVQPCQTALTHEAGFHVKNFIKDTGERRMCDLTAQVHELVNEFTKEVAHSFNNWVSESKVEEVGGRKGNDFEPSWRSKTFQTFVADHAKKIVALKFSLLTPRDLGLLEDDEATMSHTLPMENVECMLCGKTLSGDGQSCSSHICEPRCMDTVKVAMATGEVDKHSSPHHNTTHHVPNGFVSVGDVECIV